MKLQDLKQYGPKPPPRLERSTTSPGLETLLTGEIAQISNGRSFHREEIYGPGYVHGVHPLIQVGAVSGSRLGLISKDPELSYIDVRNAVFLDTETTGLGMGTGTYVFLVGAGYLDGDSFRVRQFFLGGPQEEGAYLDALDRFLRSFSVIVTFNGKAFDWPLLEGRFARYRREMPLRDPPHVDLLHPARRLWKRRLDSCALTSLEAAILGVSRTRADVSGWEIPQRYFAYLRAGDALGLEGVFYHNLQDILSLASLMVRVDEVIQDPHCGHVDHGVDFLSVGKVFERAGEFETAIGCFEEALRRVMDAELRVETLSRLSGTQKRLRWWEAALGTWERMVDEGGEAAMPALIEMAKYYEHVERDFGAALDAVRHAMMLVELRTGMLDEAEDRDLQHRHARLTDRLASGRRRAWSRVG